MDSETILVIFLSCALGVFLVIGIVALVKLVQVLDRVKKVTEHAERIGERAETVAQVLQESAMQLSIGKFLMRFTKAFKKGKHD